MTQHTEFSCDGPGCDETTKAVNGNYSRWLTLVIRVPQMPVYNTQHGLLTEPHTAHFHHPRCLLRWVEAQQGTAWTGEPDVLGNVPKEWATDA
jgi:hypothetical protein